MGIDTTFYAVYGVYIPNNVFFSKPKVTKVPSCTHDAEARKSKHCSTCGVKVTMRDSVEYEDLHDELYDYVSQEFIEVRNNQDRVIGYLFGANEVLDKYDDKPFRTFEPFNNAVILNDLSEALARCPKPISFTATEADLKFYAYVCSR